MATEALQHPVVRSIVETFDGEVLAIDPSPLPDFPPVAELLAAEVVYVAPDLAAFALPERLGLARDVTQVDVAAGGTDKVRAYRLLEAPWYVWLYHAMRRASQAADAGQLQPATWQEMRRRFNVLWTWARQRWGSRKLDELHRTGTDDRYAPPTPITLYHR